MVRTLDAGKTQVEFLAARGDVSVSVKPKQSYGPMDGQSLRSAGMVKHAFCAGAFMILPSFRTAVRLSHAVFMSDVQWLQRVALSGMTDRQKGHSLVVGAAGASAGCWR